MPATWQDTLGDGFRGRVRYRRHFNCPTGLSPDERVWIVVEGVDARGEVSVNDDRCGPIDGYSLAAEFDITPHLRPSNVLSLDIDLPGVSRPGVVRPGRTHLAGGPIGEVRLEIRAPWHIADLSICCAADEGDRASATIEGRVPGGAAPARLSLVATACGRELFCTDVAPDMPFRHVAPADDWPRWPDADGEPVLTPVEVKLLADGRAVWQATIETAPPAPADAPLRRAMLDRLAADQAAGRVEWLDYVAADSAELADLLRRYAGRVVGTRAILTEACYRAFDLANVGIVQVVPAAWAARVRPRLAHHPSIVAWRIADETSAGEVPATPRGESSC